MDILEFLFCVFVISIPLMAIVLGLSWVFVKLMETTDNILRKNERYRKRSDRKRKEFSESVFRGVHGTGLGSTAINHIIQEKLKLMGELK